LRGNQIGDTGATALARSPFLHRLTSLDLSRNQLGDDGARALADSPGLSRLEELTVYDNQLTDAGVLALLTSPHLTDVREAGFVYPGGHGYDASQLRIARGLSRLRPEVTGGPPLLHLSTSEMRASLDALLDWPHLECVQSLYVGCWPLADITRL